ncbi:hypothetical protein OAQ60_02295 [Methylophilaceae bacterium]|nr:hypothetical protein [Methylophilaceae bacterium]
MKFKWKGLEKNNFAEGEIEAEEKEDAIYLLKEQGVTVTTIEPLEKPPQKKESTTSISKCKNYR